MMKMRMILLAALLPVTVQAADLITFWDTPATAVTALTVCRRIRPTLTACGVMVPAGCGFHGINGNLKAGIF